MPPPSGYCCAPLQWGHRLSAMETGAWWASSMIRTSGRLQWGHRLSAMETLPAAESGSRRELLLQWGHRLSAMETWDQKPTLTRPSKLQWGHRLSAMETSLCLISLLLGSSLQWGHRLSAMETRIAVNVISIFTVHASMGPPPFGDGNNQTCKTSETSLPSFNGATAFRRWKLWKRSR